MIKEIRDSIFHIAIFCAIAVLYWVGQEGGNQYVINLVTVLDIIVIIFAIIMTIAVFRLDEYFAENPPKKMLTKIDLVRTNTLYMVVILECALIGKVLMTFVWIVLLLNIRSYCADHNKLYLAEHPEEETKSGKSKLEEMADD